MTACTRLDKGVVVCACGSASFVFASWSPSGSSRPLTYAMTYNHDLELRFHLIGGQWNAARTALVCCGNEVSVSNAVAIKDSQGWSFY